MRPAFSFGPACLQTLPRFTKKPALLGPSLSEDCLSLNIWSPNAGVSRRPVFFWIHGGGFTGGSAKLYPAAHLAQAGDLVAVTVNYRLGVFGFVNFGDLLNGETSASNLGLRDLIQALR
jgi:para-nitrobenzyl esterase